MNKKVSLGLLVALTFTPVWADEVDEITVSATGMPTPISQIGVSVDVMTADDLQRQQITYLHDALASVAGVGSYQSGGPGATSNVFLRGMTGNYSAVYVDGVQINDPASQQTAWAYLSAHGLESVEVLRGSQGVLFGSEAIGGAISLFTAYGGETMNRVALESGSFGTQNFSLSSRGAVGHVDYGLFVEQIESDGISAANAADGNREDDGYESLSARGRAVIHLSDRLSVDVALRSVSSEVETDAGFATPIDNDTNYTDFDAVGGRLALTYQGENRQHYFSHGRSEDISSAYTSGTLTTRGMRETSSYRSTKIYNDGMQILLGVEQEIETYETDNAVYEADNVAALAVMQFQSGPLRGSVAARRDEHESFGKYDTFRFSTLIKGGQTATRFSYGTGFRAPSLYQMFGRSDYCVANICGHDALQPEESRAYEAAFIFKPSEKFSVEIARFNITVSDFVIYGSAAPSDPNDPCLAFNSFPGFTATSCGKYQQTSGDSRSQGYELRFAASFNEATSLKGNFTKLDAKKENGQRDIRRPEETLNISLNHELTEALNMGLSVKAVRHVTDTDFAQFPNVDVPLNDYDLVNMRVAYQLNEGSELHARLENAFDEDYETVLGYGTPGRAFYVGLSSRF